MQNKKQAGTSNHLQGCNHWLRRSTLWPIEISTFRVDLQSRQKTSKFSPSSPATHAEDVCSVCIQGIQATRFSLPTVYHVFPWFAIRFPPFLHCCLKQRLYFKSMSRAHARVIVCIPRDIGSVVVRAKGILCAIFLSPRWPGLARGYCHPLSSISPPPAVSHRETGRPPRFEPPRDHPSIMPFFDQVARHPAETVLRPWSKGSPSTNPPGHRKRTSSRVKSASRKTKWMWKRLSPWRPSIA